MRKPPNEPLTTDRPHSATAEGETKGSDFPRSAKRGGTHVPERKCILTGMHGERDNLIRLALGPDGQIAPDVRAKAPGRGAWIAVDRPRLQAALDKGKLKGALIRAFKTSEISIAPDLADRIEAALRQTALDRLGLEARSGTLLTGSEKIETAARRGEVHLLIHASDASEDGNRKLDQAWRVGTQDDDQPSQGLVFPVERTILSLALGRQNVVHIAIIDRAAAARVRHALDRWRAFIGTNDGLSAGAADTPGASAVNVNEGLE